MKVKKFLLIGLVLILILIMCCYYFIGDKNISQKLINPSILQADNDENQDALESSQNPFSIIVKGKTISLSDLISDIDLINLFGEPISDTRKKMGSDADILEGKTYRNLSFNGINIVLTTNVNDDKNFYVDSMVITGDEFKTIDDIKVGDTVEKIKMIYKNLRLVDGENDIKCTYEFHDDQIKAMDFYIVDGRVIKIIIATEIP